MVMVGTVRGQRRYARIATRGRKRSSRWIGRRANVVVRRRESAYFFRAATTRQVAGSQWTADWLAAGGTVIAAASWGLLASLLG